MTKITREMMRQRLEYDKTLPSRLLRINCTVKTTLVIPEIRIPRGKTKNAKNIKYPPRE